MRRLIHSFLPLCLVLTFAGAAAAQTPDGSPPSEETVCDGQTGAAYGLCNAFCEAMDCDSDDPQASQTGPRVHVELTRAGAGCRCATAASTEFVTVIDTRPLRPRGHTRGLPEAEMKLSWKYFTPRS